MQHASEIDEPTTKPRTSAMALVVVLGAISLFVTATTSGCGDGDPSTGGVDASTDTASFDADPCSAYTSVGKTCNLQPGRICFKQCATGGCFCQGGVWACINDQTCYGDSSLFDDAGREPVDASTDAVPEAAADAAPEASNDASVDAADAPSDAADAAADAPGDAADAG